MLTKEEYKRTFIRMMDSLREEYKGTYYCDGISCYDCPIGDVCRGRLTDPYVVIEAVEQWGKEHPIVTNADKF